MSLQNGQWTEKIKDFLERLLALKITDRERLRYANDPSNIFLEDVSGRKPLQVATILAIFFHILLFLLTLPSFQKNLPPAEVVLQLRQLAPARLAGGAPPKQAVAPPKPKPTIPKPKPILVPIPDPTPNAPEPIIKKEPDEIPPVVAEMTEELNIGDPTAPPGVGTQGKAGRGDSGEGTGPTTGPGSGAGNGEGIREVGGLGVTNPVLLVKTTPQYTDDAIKAKIQGTVLIQCIIRTNGRADSFHVIRPLGYGLDEMAIKEIAQNWKFRPGTYHGQPIDVKATIEVTFNLR